jgi:hypothetical protein
MSAMYASFVFPTGAFPSQCNVNACDPRRPRQQAGRRAEGHNLAWRRLWIVIVRCLRAGHGWLQAWEAQRWSSFEMSRHLARGSVLVRAGCWLPYAGPW